MITFYTCLNYIKLPRNNTKYILKYKIYKEKNAPVEKQIKALEDYKNKVTNINVENLSQIENEFIKITEVNK